MKYFIYIVIFLFPLFGFSQKYAPKDYYLVDSLNLDDIADNDKKLIESSLNLFHKAKDDTSKTPEVKYLTILPGLEGKKARAKLH